MIGSSGARAPWRILLPAGIGTALSLVGDSTLYTVLPTHTAVAGVAWIAEDGTMFWSFREDCLG